MSCVDRDFSALERFGSSRKRARGATTDRRRGRSSKMVEVEDVIADFG
jgi:hypothetical protein